MLAGLTRIDHTRRAAAYCGEEAVIMVKNQTACWARCPQCGHEHWLVETERETPEEGITFDLDNPHCGQCGCEMEPIGEWVVWG
jgi:hypothetical protein